MDTQTQTSQPNEAAALKALFVKMAVDAWQTQNKRMNDLLEKLSEEEWKQQTAPGRNTGAYLLGHLTAVNDNLLVIFGFQEKLYPQLAKIFIDEPDQPEMERPPVDELKRYWADVNAKLMEHMNKMQPDDWFTKHTAVSEADFAKEPHRNKLNVLMNRTTHQGYHLGQLNYLVKKK